MVDRNVDAAWVKQTDWVRRVLGVDAGRGTGARAAAAGRPDAGPPGTAGAPSQVQPSARSRAGSEAQTDAGAQTQSAARGDEAKAANARGIAYPKLLLRWQAAQNEAVSALDRAGKAYLALPKVKADPRYDRVQVAIATLPGLIPTLGEELRDLLDQGINAGSDAAIAEDALAVVARYRDSLGGAAKLTAFEQFAKQQVGECAVIATLDGALAEIAERLRTAL